MIAVTTHARLSGLRHTIPALLASRSIGDDLRVAPGCDRFMNVMVGPREIWTLTIWRSRRDMRAFMIDGAHGRVIWRRPRWLECYWGMRWEPGRSGGGEWEGKPWSMAGEPVPAPAPQPAIPSSVLRAVPSLRAALDETVSPESRQVAGATGATYRIKAPAPRFAAALRDLRRLRRFIERDPDVFRVSVGLGTAGALCLLAVFKSPDGLRRLEGSAEHRRLADRWGGRAWWFTWTPESEFGQWRGGKLREGQLAEAPLVIDLSLAAVPAAAGEARRAVRGEFGRLEPDTLELLVLLVSEVVANSVRHAGLGEEDQVGLRVRAEGGWVRVEVADRGRQFDPRVPRSKGPDDESGWGLFTVNRVAERWGIIPGSPRRIWFELRAPASQAVASSV